MGRGGGAGNYTGSAADRSRPTQRARCASVAHRRHVASGVEGADERAVVADVDGGDRARIPEGVERPPERFEAVERGGPEAGAGPPLARRHVGLVVEPVRLPLVVEARRRDRLGERQQ